MTADPAGGVPAPAVAFPGAARALSRLGWAILQVLPAWLAARVLVAVALVVAHLTVRSLRPDNPAARAAGPRGAAGLGRRVVPLHRRPRVRGGRTRVAPVLPALPDARPVPRPPTGCRHRGGPGGGVQRRLPTGHGRPAASWCATTSATPPWAAGRCGCWPWPRRPTRWSWPTPTPSSCCVRWSPSSVSGPGVGGGRPPPGWPPGADPARGRAVGGAGGARALVPPGLPSRRPGAGWPLRPPWSPRRSGPGRLPRLGRPSLRRRLAAADGAGAGRSPGPARRAPRRHVATT